MPKSRNLLACCCLVLLAAPAVAVAFTFVSGSAVDKPDDPGFVYNRTVFDCEPPDSLTITIGLSTTLSDSTTGRTSLIDGYPCRSWPERGPEIVYKLDVAADLELTAYLTAAVDLDLFLLRTCDSDSCLLGENTEFTAVLAAGIYYLVVDGYGGSNPAAGSFDLALTARPVGVPPAICEPGGALPVACAGETITLTGETLFGRPDLIRSYDCGTFPRTSGDAWYELTLPPTHGVTVNLRSIATAADPCLWLFDGCGADARCLQFVDTNLAGSGESLTLSNEGGADLTVWLAVDAARPPASESAGSYDIDFQCQSNVPTAQTSFGSLKALYR